MRILSIHNEYLIKGGEEESRKSEISVLEYYGNEVVSYTENNLDIKKLNKSSIALRTLWSKESYYNTKQILMTKKFDIVHVQNFFPLISASVYYAAKSERVPVIQAVRNYRLVCPNALLFRDGHVCELCIKKTIKIDSIKHQCYRNNFTASLAASSMLMLHNSLRTWKHVNMFVATSEFLKQKMIEGGFSGKNIIVKPNFVYPDPNISLIKENYIVYIGRLQSEKGILTLLNAFNLIKSDLNLKVIGEGPLTPHVIEASTGTKIQYLGKLSLDDTYDTIGKAKVLIIPSLWHEPFGRVIIEAYAKGTPVIGSHMGGIPELIREGITGYTFEAGNEESLANKIDELCQNEDLLFKMSLACRKEYLSKYTPEINYNILMGIYNNVLDSNS